MSLTLPKALFAYDKNNEQQTRLQIEQADAGNLKKSSYTEGVWTPTDASGASLTLVVSRAIWKRIGNLIFIQGVISYPVTANGSNAVIGGLPIAVPTNGDSLLPALTGNANGAAYLVLSSGTSTGKIYKPNGAVTNANMSNSNIVFSGVYPAT